MIDEDLNVWLFRLFKSLFIFYGEYLVSLSIKNDR